MLWLTLPANETEGRCNINGKPHGSPNRAHPPACVMSMYGSPAEFFLDVPEESKPASNAVSACLGQLMAEVR
jgi:hypothetical protein